MKNRLVLGVDIGGSHITAMLVDLENKCTIKNSEVRKDVNSRGSADEIIDSWANVIINAFGNKMPAIKKIGIAMPGPFDYENGIAWMKNQDKFDSLYGLNVKDLLAEKINIPSKNIRFINDAESFLKGEVYSNTELEGLNVFGITLGTGLGSAKYLNGKVTDANLWNTRLLDGIAEDYLCTRWFVKRYLQLTGNTITGVKQLAGLNDKFSLQIFKEFGNNLGIFLKPFILKDNIDAVILGGNIAKAHPFFTQALTASLRDIAAKPTIHPAWLGEEAPLIGAASCWAENKEEILKTANA